MAVVGIDCGVRSFTVTVLGESTSEVKVAQYKKYDTPRKERRSRELQALARRVSTLHNDLDLAPNTFFVVEAPIVAGVRNLRSSLHLSQVTGIVQAGLPDIIEVAVAQWKKEVVGKGNASKEEVARWVEDNHPEAYEYLKGSQDALDAFCIALYGEAVQDRLHTTLSTWRGDSS